MLKRRASKRFVLVESGEDNANGSGPGSGSGVGSGPVIPQFVAVDCGQNETNNNANEMSASISNHSANNNQSSPSLLGVPVVGTLK